MKRETHGRPITGRLVGERFDVERWRVRRVEHFSHRPFPAREVSKEWHGPIARLIRYVVSQRVAVVANGEEAGVVRSDVPMRKLEEVLLTQKLRNRWIV